MTDAPAPEPPPGASAARAPSSRPDIEGWRRLHPLTPLLRGGWIVIAVLGWIISQQWNLLVSVFVPDEFEPYRYEDPTWRFISEPGRLLLLLGGTVLVALLVVLFSYLAWRNHRYRLTDEVFEVREGVLSRKNRQARLDRIQSIDVNRPAFARIFGAAVVVIDTASSSGNIDLKYVRASEAESLRAEILRVASGAKRRAGARGQWPDAPGATARTGPDAPGRDPASAGAREPSGGDGIDAAVGAGAAAGVIGGSAAAGSPGARLAGLIRTRIEEFTDFDAETRGVAPSSIVQISAGRLIAITVIDLVVGLFFAVLVIAAMFAIMLVGSIVWGDGPGPWILGAGFGILFGAGLPFVVISIAMASRRLFPNLNYSIVGTPDGIRVSRGVPSTTSETVPPGRIHAVEVRQPLLWRMFGWWEVRTTRAGAKIDASDGSAKQSQQHSVLLPVGSVVDVFRVLDLVSPLQAGPGRARLVEAGMLGTGREPGAAEARTANRLDLDAADGYHPAPVRGAWLRPFSWRRTGYALAGATLFIRHGVLERRLAIVPAERMQSIAAGQGPVTRALRLAHVHAHTVQGVVNTRIPIVDAGLAVGLFDRLSNVAIEAASRDSSHRWQEAMARSAIAASRMRIADAEARGVAPSRFDLAVMDALREFDAAGGAAAPDSRRDDGAGS